jgi:DNA polymerase-3 subunit epsilon
MTSFAALDFETSDYSPDSACAIGIVRVEDNTIVKKYSHLIKPPRQRMRFTDVHGITWADVAHQPTFADLWPEIEKHLSDVDFIVAHNASFDKRVLYGCCNFYSISAPPLAFKCTVQVARNHFGIRPANLANVCKFLKIALNHHEALSDAMACAQIMLLALNSQKPVSPRENSLLS